MARYGDTFFSATDTAYLIFLVMGIVGYFTVPSVANYIVHASGGNVLLSRSSNVFIGGATSAVSTAIGGASTAVTGLAGAGATNQQNASSGSGASQANSNDYMHNKLSGG